MPGTGRASPPSRPIPGRVALESVLRVAGRLSFIRGLALPREALAGVGPAVIERLRRRVAQENGWEMRRHPRERRLGLFALYLVTREAALVDGLVDLLIETVHKIGVKAERRTAAALVRDVERVHGKERLLVDIAAAAVDHPDDPVRTAIFPVAGEGKLRAVMAEHRARGTWDRQVQTVIRNSYRSPLPADAAAALGALEFRSNNDAHRPVIRPRHCSSGMPTAGCTYPPDEESPWTAWCGALAGGGHRTEDPGGRVRVNRITYEICVLQALREQLRCKEVWVGGPTATATPRRMCRPTSTTRRDAYYDAPGPAAGGRGIPRRRAAGDGARPCGPWTRAAAQRPRADRPGRRLGSRSAPGGPARAGEPDRPEGGDRRRWPMTGLLDMLKEADLRVHFSDAFATATAREQLDRATLQQRLLLCLYGLGTNTGLKRIAAGATAPATRTCSTSGGGSSPRPPARGDHAGGQRDLPRPHPADLGRGHDGLRVRLARSSAPGTRT